MSQKGFVDSASCLNYESEMATIDYYFYILHSKDFMDSF